MSECTVVGLKEILENGEIHLVDVREQMEFAGGRVAGASLLPLGELEERHKELDHSKPIYVMCRTGRRSSDAQRKLKALGFTNVVNVVGGMEDWKKEGLPVERDEYAPWSIERQVRFTAGSLVLIGVLLSVFVHPYFLILSGLIGFGLAFTATIDWCGMGLLIAKMPWNRRAV
ncbi:MAG TPA: rhodanese-like domain-containing protein [Pyrinomonadaceae bacterium]|jgi:rhodanese-related sulfurtransferase|nr:rhodanese-like domain-containing protein [Pyrinomonadaceae bacterium]